MLCSPTSIRPGTTWGRTRLRGAAHVAHHVLGKRPGDLLAAQSRAVPHRRTPPLAMLGQTGQAGGALSALAGTVTLSFAPDAAAASPWSFQDFCASGPRSSRRARAAAAREAGGPLSWKAFCSARGWFVTSAARKREVDADGINRNCASLLNGGVLRWSPEEEEDARAHQVACFKRGEVVSVSEFATPRFHPFIDADAERSGVPDPTHLGLDIARVAQRELRRFCVSAGGRDDGGAATGRSRKKLFDAVVLVAPPKELPHAPAFAVAAGAGGEHRWYKRGYHVVFPNVLVSVHEWRHLLAAVAAACGRALDGRDPRQASPWHLTIDVACGPNLRAPFSDKTARCEQCARDAPLRRKRHRAAAAGGARGGGGGEASSSVVIVHGDGRTGARASAPGCGAGASGDAGHADDVGEGADALRALRELGTPEGRHRNSSSCCGNTHCVDGYVPEGRPYTVHAVLDGDGSVNEHVTQRALRSYTFAYSLATIRAPGARFSYPEFRIYDGAPSVEDALRRANKDPATVLRVPAAALAPRDARASSRSLTHPAVLSGGDAAARESIARMAHRVAITDEPRIRCMLRNAQKLHRCFEGVIADKAWTNRQRSYCILVVTGEASRRCLNLLPGRDPGSSDGTGSAAAARTTTLPGSHRAPKRAYFFFSPDSGTVTQRCWCKCETGEGRVGGKWCRNFRSHPRKLAASDRVLLFGSAEGRPRMTSRQIAASFRLSKGNDVLLPAGPGTLETHQATAVGTVARIPPAGAGEHPQDSLTRHGDNCARPRASRSSHAPPTPREVTSQVGSPPASQARQGDDRESGSARFSEGNYARRLLSGRRGVWAALLAGPRADGQGGCGDGKESRGGGVAAIERKKRRTAEKTAAQARRNRDADEVVAVPQRRLGVESAVASPQSSMVAPRVESRGVCALFSSRTADAPSVHGAGVSLVAPLDPRSVTMDEELMLHGGSADGSGAEKGKGRAGPALLDLVLLGGRIPPTER